MAQHRIRLEDHLSQPWLVHDLLADLSVEDVWEFPVRLRPGDSLADFRREMTVAVRNMNPLDPAALLFRIRYTIGKLFRWDRVQGTPWRRRLYDRFVAAHPELPATDAVAEVEAATVYETPDEYLGEIENRTVLAGLHLSRISVGDGAYGVRLAVYVKPKGRGGRLYMSLIKPFRLWVVYPAIMKAVASRWRQYVATTSPPD